MQKECNNCVNDSCHGRRKVKNCPDYKSPKPLTAKLADLNAFRYSVQRGRANAS